MRDFLFLRPDSVKTALKAKEEEREKGHILAGGTNLLSYIKMGRVKQGLLIDITRLDELRRIEEKADRITFGASLTIRELLDSPVVRKRMPAFFESLLTFANPLIRNKATLGGNVADASPIADTAPLLLVMDATVRATGTKGSRDIPMAEFFTGPGKTVLRADEIITAVDVPVNESSMIKMVKLGLRKGTACSVTSAAVRLEMEDGRLRTLRIAAGGVAPTPVRAYNCEKALQGGTFSTDFIEAHIGALQQDISPISDVRGSGEYRREVTANLVKRALRCAAGMEE